MAVTGFWPVFKNLKATLDYADNPDKTTAPEYLDEDLYAALRYAENDDKTDCKMFVGGINCSAQNAYAEMIAVQRRFGLRGKVVGYHGIQSFREGEVTPEQAFAIGKETARRMWGDRYQVLVTVHLNTDNVHCHFVVNPVSFKDGAKDLIGAALVVAMAQGIMQVLGGSDPTTPTVINTIMYGISQALAGLSGAAAAVLMYVFQSVFNFFVVSGSGQAAITMPIMAPLADLLGVSRQTSVLAFQLGDAFTNLIVPTSGCLIGSLAIAKIEWSNWIKFMWKFLGILMIGAVITILIAVAIGF